MGCGCGKKKRYIVTKKDGTTETVDSLVAAMKVIRTHGGHYQQVRV